MDMRVGVELFMANRLRGLLNLILFRYDNSLTFFRATFSLKINDPRDDCYFFPLFPAGSPAGSQSKCLSKLTGFPAVSLRTIGSPAFTRNGAENPVRSARHAPESRVSLGHKRAEEKLGELGCDPPCVGRKKAASSGRQIEFNACEISSNAARNPS